MIVSLGWLDSIQHERSQRIWNLVPTFLQQSIAHQAQNENAERHAGDCARHQPWIDPLFRLCTELMVGMLLGHAKGRRDE